MGRALWAFLLVTGAALAGCSSGGAPAAPDEPGPTGLVATSTTGVIRGVVVDDAIRPLPNATVQARGPAEANRTALTDADGFFGFEGLAPGTWFVSGAKLAYQDAQQSVEVLAGVAEPPVVKLQLVFVPSKAPFVVVYKYEGFAECIVPGANVCAIANLYPCVFLGQCSNFTDDKSIVLYYDPLVSLQRTPDWFQTEIVWESTQAVTDMLSIRYSAHSPDDGTGVDARVASVHGRSPLLLSLNRT
ncbi:MAG: Carboxypeptidase regulatory-like domain, partial [Thermoplasmata archaeon]|nr:Carboxypeptidase regulatory-like domain [Thermoplasmata archaeon]